MKTQKLHQYFGVPEHKISVSAQDFIHGKLPAIVKKANKAGHIVTLSVTPEAAFCDNEPKTDSVAAIRAAFETWWRTECNRVPTVWNDKYIAQMAWLKGAETALKVTK